MITAVMEQLSDNLRFSVLEENIYRVYPDLYNLAFAIKLCQK